MPGRDRSEVADLPVLVAEEARHVLRVLGLPGTQDNLRPTRCAERREFVRCPPFPLCKLPAMSQRVLLVSIMKYLLERFCRLDCRGGIGVAHRDALRQFERLRGEKFVSTSCGLPVDPFPPGCALHDSPCPFRRNVCKRHPVPTLARSST